MVTPNPCEREESNIVMNAADFVEQAKSEVHEVSQDEAQALIDRGAAVLDVRDPNEVNKGTLPGALTVSRGMLEWKIEKALASKNQTIVVYCASGGRSALAAQTMQRMGYTDVHSLTGGFATWQDDGRPVAHS